MRKVRLILIIAIFYCVTNVYAEESYQRVNLSASAQQQAENDLMNMVLVVRAHNIKPAKIAKVINETMNWALGFLKDKKNIIVQTQNYHINPVYKKERLIEWRGQQRLVLKSADIALMSKVAAILLQRMQMQSQNYSLSFDKKEKIENQLIKKALESLKKRALIVQNSFSARRYRLVNLRINTSSSATPYPVMYRAKMAYESAQDIASVASKAGESMVKVTVSAEIELVI